MVVFGSVEAKDTDKQRQTIQPNIKEGEAVYLYADTSKLDPNSDLGKVARRNAEQGQGLGAAGKSDLAFTGIYTVQKQADGSLGLGKSTATFHGGRSEISAIMREQLQYAKRATLNLGGGTTPPDAIPNPTDENQTDAKPESDQGPVKPRNFDSNLPDGQPKDPYDYHQNQNKDKKDTDDGGRKDGTERQESDRRDADRRDADRKEGERRESELRESNDRKAAQERLEKARHKAIVPEGKTDSLEKYGESWGKFLSSEGMEKGPTHELLSAFGMQLFTGKFDGEQLASLMDKVSVQDQAALDESLKNVNKRLAQDGLQLNLKFDPASKKVSELEMTTTDSPKTSVSIDSSGKLDGKDIKDHKSDPMRFWRASIKLAKQAEPSACP